MDKVNFETYAASQNAIREYIHFRTENANMHNAKVVVFSMGEVTFEDVVKVIAKIETNNSSVDIFGDAQFERDYYTTCNNEYQKFSFSDGTLTIETNDRLGNKIKIEITGV